MKDWSFIMWFTESVDRQLCGWARVTRKLCAQHKNASWVLSIGDFVLEGLSCAQRLWILPCSGKFFSHVLANSVRYIYRQIHLDWKWRRYGELVKTMSKLPMLSEHARRTGVDIKQITSYSPTSWIGRRPRLALRVLYLLTNITNKWFNMTLNLLS